MELTLENIAKRRSRSGMSKRPTASRSSHGSGSPSTGLPGLPATARGLCGDLSETSSRGWGIDRLGAFTHRRFLPCCVGLRREGQGNGTPSAEQLWAGFPVCRRHRARISRSVRRPSRGAVKGEEVARCGEDRSGGRCGDSANAGRLSGESACPLRDAPRSAAIRAAW